MQRLYDSTNHKINTYSPAGRAEWGTVKADLFQSTTFDLSVPPPRTLELYRCAYSVHNKAHLTWSQADRYGTGNLSTSNQQLQQRRNRRALVFSSNLCCCKQPLDVPTYPVYQVPCVESPSVRNEIGIYANYVQHHLASRHDDIQLGWRFASRTGTHGECHHCCFISATSSPAFLHFESVEDELLYFLGNLMLETAENVRDLLLLCANSGCKMFP